MTFIYLHIIYDGQQHYYPVDFANKGEKWATELYNKNIFRDNIKNDYCKKKNITMIRVPYWEINNIENILYNKIIESQETAGRI